MPVLMDGHPWQIRCHRYRKHGHIAWECPRKKRHGCRVCGNSGHIKADCPLKARPAVQVFVNQEVSREVQELGKMTLLDCIALMGRLEWMPPFCNKCGKSNLQHMELDCPRYEYCDWCRQTGAFGFIKKHRCQYVEEEDTHMDKEWDADWDNGND
jgi:Zinc knuckle